MSDDVDRVLQKCFYLTVLTVVAPNKMQIGFGFVFLMAAAPESGKKEQAFRSQASSQGAM